jgi:ubiquinone/menaquinone biosynthesis C-methylase UbiE
MAKFLEIAAENPRGLTWEVMNLATHSGVEKGDATNLPLPYSDNEFFGVYSEHFIEHVYKYQGIKFFKDVMRILKPGGVVRTVWPPYEFVDLLVSGEELTPDQQMFVEHYYNFYIVKEKFSPPGNSHRSKREQCALGLLYQKGQHLYVWSKIEMMNMLKDLGYTNVKLMNYQDSSVADFKNIDTPGQIRALHSAVVEASKPW